MATATSQQIEARVVEALVSFGPDESQINRDATFEELTSTRSTWSSSLRSSRTNTAWSSRART